MEPLHPETIVIQNNFYPNGLTEKMVWNYYQENKFRILKESSGKDIVLFVFIRENEYIVRRFINYQNIRLTSKTYDHIINGRTVSVSIEPGDPLDYLCLDIDSSESTDENLKKEAVKDVIDIYLHMPQVNKIRIISTSSGYHVYGMLIKKIPDSVAINLLRKRLNISLKEKYGIGERRESSSKEIVLDFAPMYSRGSHILPYAINRNGLIAMDVTKTLDSFNRSDAIIK